MAVINYNKTRVPVDREFDNYNEFMNWSDTKGRPVLTSFQRKSIMFGDLWKKRFIPAEIDALDSRVTVHVFLGKMTNPNPNPSDVHFITLRYIPRSGGKQKKEVPFMKVKNYNNYLEHTKEVCQMVLQRQAEWEEDK